MLKIGKETKRVLENVDLPLLADQTDFIERLGTDHSATGIELLYQKHDVENCLGGILELLADLHNALSFDNQ